MAEQKSQRGSGGGGKSWDHYDSYKNLKIFSGDAKDFEECSVKLRNLVAAAYIIVNKLIGSVEAACNEHQLVNRLYKELTQISRRVTPILS